MIAYHDTIGLEIVRIKGVDVDLLGEGGKKITRIAILDGVDVAIVLSDHAKVECSGVGGGGLRGAVDELARDKEGDTGGRW